jgi:hypothetical protein
MKLSGSADKENEYWFTGSVRCQSSGRQGVTVRILPKNEEISDQCELGLVLWEGAKN